MSQLVRVLFIEDSEDDFLILMGALELGGYEVIFKRVVNESTLRDALNQGPWDVVLSDYSLPGFDGLAALALVKAHSPDLPFIIVSGNIGEEIAVAAMRDGAQDYILKDNLSRLVPALERELRETEGRRARKKAEEDLEQSEDRLRRSQKLEAIGQLAGGVAHDFNNHLTVILGYSEIMMEELGEASPLYSAARTIRDTAHRSAMLTRQLLAFSRKQLLEPRVLDLNRLVLDMGNMLRPLIGEHLELTMSLDPGLGKILADAGQIEQVVTNLVVNARDAMPDGGRITVETTNVELDASFAAQHVPTREGAYVLLMVSDTGIGMNREIQEHIFEPFFTTKDAEHGTGLGLATVYGIVKQSGGYIWVYSEVGQGTVFKVYLPKLEGAVEASGDGRTPRGTLAGSETILLVEDEESLLALVREYLEKAGYQVLEAANGGDAILASESHPGPIDIVITDILMPGMASTELIRRLQERRPGIEALYMSGYTNDTVFRNRMVDRDANFLQKPFTRIDILTKVREILD